MATHDLHFESLVGPGVAPVEKAYVEVKAADDFFVDGTAIVWSVPQSYEFVDGEVTVPDMADTDSSATDVVWSVRHVFTDGRGHVVGPSPTATFKFKPGAGSTVEWTDDTAIEQVDPVEPIEWGPTYLAQTRELRDETEVLRDEAEAAKTAAEAVPLSNDTIIAGRINTPGSETRAALDATYVPLWKATTAYAVDDQVKSPAGDIVSATTAHTSGSSYDSTKWTLASSLVYSKTAADAAFVGPILTTNDSGMGVRRKASAAHGTGYIFGTAASFGFSGTGSPADIAGAFGIYQEYGKASKGSDILKTTQGGYAVTNYWGPTVDDSAEGFSSAVILKAGPSGFTQTKPLTAFEAIAQVEDGNTLDDASGAYALGVGSRINVLGAGRIKQGYGFKASVNTSGGPPYGTIDKYTAFAQIQGSGAATAYGLYVVDQAISETAIGVGASGWTGQATIKRAGNSDSAVSLMVLKGPDTSPGLTELSLVAGTSQTRSIMEARDSGGTARFQITSAGAVNMRGQQISVNDSSGAAQMILAPATGITFTDARDIVVGSTTGTKIGTSATQKLGFWGKAPIVRPTLPGAGVVTADDIRGLLIAIGVAA